MLYKIGYDRSIKKSHPDKKLEKAAVGCTMIRKKIFTQDPREQVKIDSTVKNLSDPINDLICSQCLIYVNCSESCEHLKEIYSRIGQEFYDDETLYQPKHLRTKKMLNDIRSRVIQIVKEYLREKEICYGTEGDDGNNDSS